MPQQKEKRNRQGEPHISAIIDLIGTVPGATDEFRTIVSDSFLRFIQDGTIDPEVLAFTYPHPNIFLHHWLTRDRTPEDNLIPLPEHALHRYCLNDLAEIFFRDYTQTQEDIDSGIPRSFPILHSAAYIPEVDSENLYTTPEIIPYTWANTDQPHILTISDSRTTLDWMYQVAESLYRFNLHDYQSESNPFCIHFVDARTNPLHRTPPEEIGMMIASIAHGSDYEPGYIHSIIKQIQSRHTEDTYDDPLDVLVVIDDFEAFYQAIPSRERVSTISTLFSDHTHGFQILANIRPETIAKYMKDQQTRALLRKITGSNHIARLLGPTSEPRSRLLETLLSNDDIEIMTSITSSMIVDTTDRNNPLPLWIPRIA